MATLGDDDLSIAFTAQLKNVAFAHCAYGSLPKSRFGQMFDRIIIDFERAKGISAGSNQYEAYCKYDGLNPRIDC